MNSWPVLRLRVCPRCGSNYLYDPIELARCPDCCDIPSDWVPDREESAIRVRRTCTVSAEDTAVGKTVVSPVSEKMIYSRENSHRSRPLS